MSDDTSTADAGLDIDDATAEQLLADPPAAKPDTGDSTDWKAETEKWKAQARKHEARARENAQAAQKAKTVEQQVADLQQRLSDRDAADEAATVSRAVDQLTARLIRAGLSDAEASEFAADVAPSRLMADGKPDAKAIEAVALRYAKHTGRATPDPDQGKKGGKAPLDMNQLIRRAAGISS